MKTRKDAKIKREYSMIRDIASRLGRNPLFAGGENAVCRLYAKVPFRYVEYDGTPLEETSASFDGRAWENFGDCVFDLLVCRNGGNGETALAILFNPGLKRSEPPIAHMTIRTRPGMMAGDVLKLIERWVDEWVDEQFPAPSDLPEFALRPLPAEEVSGETGDALRAHLIRERLLLDDGRVTTYGRELGLLEQFCADEYGKSRRRWAVVQHKAELLKETLSPGTKPLVGKIPLEKRLERLENGLPGDEAYAAFLAESLRRLLETPLELLCGEDPLTTATLEDELGQAQFLLDYDPDCAQVRTYADVLGIVRELYRGYWRCGLDRTEKTEQGDAILMFLAKLLVNPPAPQYVQKQDSEPRSLKDRLSGLGTAQGAEYPILSVPVSHYYYAASILDESNYPNWLCTNRFYIRKKDKFKVDMGYMLKWYLGEIPGCKSEDILTHLYDLLVEPIFPDLEP